MKNLLFAFFVLFLFSACGNEPANDGKKESPEQNAKTIKQGDVFLVCQSAEQTNEADPPSAEVFLQLAEIKSKIADIQVCETLTPDDYAQYQIPENAISAVGGWWAGAGDYLYVVEEDGKYVVKQGEMYEEKTDNDYGYRTVVEFSSTGQQIHE